MRTLKLFILISITLIGCKTEEKLLVKENQPTVITKTASDISLTNATLNGEVADEGFSATSDRGFVYSDKNTNPTGNDSRVQVGFGKGVYSIVLDKLAVNTKYYLKAYATNSKGISFGEVQNFTTADYKLATAITDLPKNISYTTVELSGSVTDEGGGTVSESGFVLGTNLSPTISDLKFPVAKVKSTLALNVNKLNINTKYYVRSYAINEKGVAYGNEQIFSTLASTVIVEVKSKTGRIWMDRNLGATQAALNPKDEKSYGDLYQWGRGADGHQLRTSTRTSEKSSTDLPGNSFFIWSAPDWRMTKNDNLWQGINGTNNPCPKGYRLPTEDEWKSEILTWVQGGNDPFFDSRLKLPLGGSRDPWNALINFEGITGTYWSSTPNGTYDATIAGVGINSFGLGTNNLRASGACVRCIKD